MIKSEYVLKSGQEECSHIAEAHLCQSSLLSTFKTLGKDSVEEKSSHEVIRMTEIDSQSDEAAGQGVWCVQPEAPAEARGTTWRLVNRSHFPRQHQKNPTENLKWAPGIVSLKSVPGAAELFTWQLLIWYKLSF